MAVASTRVLALVLASLVLWSICGIAIVDGYLDGGVPRGANPGTDRVRRVKGVGVPGQRQEWYDEQLVDHFDPLDNRTFAQRYFVIDTYGKGDADSCVILHLCGEYTCQGLFSFRLFPLALAKQFGCLILTLEHRYFGLSQPMSSLGVDDMQYLTVPQALEDLAQFTRYYQLEMINKPLGKTLNNKWFVIGGSYPGALSGWYRLKYPHLSMGALASSAVVNAIFAYTQFDEQVAASAALSSEECVSQIRRATSAVVAGMGAPGVKAKFGAETLTDDDFLYLVADAVAEGVQYKQRKGLCEYFTSVPSNASTQLLVDVYANYTNELFYSAMGNSASEYNSSMMADPNVDPLDGGRQWWWMKCTSLAYFQVAPSQNSVRPTAIDIEFHKKRCTDIFGTAAAAAFPLAMPWPPLTNATNAMFGGSDIRATNTIFTNGIEDPWRHASVPQEGALPTSSEYSVVMDCYCAHCQDLYTPTDDDPAELQAARAFTIGKLGEWLKTEPPISF